MSDTPSNPSSTSRTRTRTGCITCRIRRVKCDEAKPNCARCARSGVVCDGYAPVGFSRRALTTAVARGIVVSSPTVRVQNSLQDAGELACFDFFRRRTAPGAGAFLPSVFWSRRVLQVAHAEPAVWSAVVALGALHRQWDAVAAARDERLLRQQQQPAGSPERRSPRAAEEQSAAFSQQALLCYGRALRLGTTIRWPAGLLVLSLALAAVANLAGRWADARVHVTSGQRLLQHIRAQGWTVADLEVDCAVESLARIDFQAISFSEASAPYPYHESDLPERGGSGNSMMIESLDQAATLLFHLFSRIMVLVGRQPASSDRISGHDDPSVEVDVRDSMVAWERSMATFLDGMRPMDRQGQQATLLSLKMYHALARSVLRVGMAGPESRWDVALPHLERVVFISSTLMRMSQPLAAPVMSVDMGIVMPLYVVATRCRHPVVRRWALTLLRQLNRREGMWESIAAAAVATKISAMEEAGLGIEASLVTYLHVPEAREWADGVCYEEPSHWLGGDEAWTSRSSWEGVSIIPEHKRFIDVHVAIDSETRTARLRMIYPSRNPDGSFRTSQAVATF